MTLSDAILLGILQGLTEFLPVSSSGHLEILSHILDVESEDNLAFSIVLHGGTVLSTIVVFRREIWRLLCGLFRFEMNPETEYMFKIGMSLIPILIVGLFFKDYIENLFGGGLLFVGCMLLITSMLLLFASRRRSGGRTISYRDAFVIGIGQALAVLPGLSRSGTTISTGLLLGDRREEVSRFSFLMVLIPIIGMNMLDIAGGDLGGGSLSAGVLVGGFLSSFIVGMAACRLMIRIVNRGGLGWFALYCFVAGTAVVVWSLCQ